MKLLTALVLAGTLFAAQKASGPGAISKDQEAVRKAERRSVVALSSVLPEFQSGRILESSG